MSDMTNDIWNDNDGEEEATRKGGRMRRFWIFFLILAAVLGVVVVAAYRDGTGFDALRRLFAYGGAEAAARGVVSPPRRRRRYRAGRRASSAAPCRSCHRCAPRDGRCEYGRGAGTWRRGRRGPSPS